MNTNQAAGRGHEERVEEERGERNGRKDNEERLEEGRGGRNGRREMKRATWDDSMSTRKRRNASSDCERLIGTGKLCG